MQSGRNFKFKVRHQRPQKELWLTVHLPSPDPNLSPLPVLPHRILTLALTDRDTEAQRLSDWLKSGSGWCLEVWMENADCSPSFRRSFMAGKADNSEDQ